jgi:hypothetical protein
MTAAEQQVHTPPIRQSYRLIAEAAEAAEAANGAVVGMSSVQHLFGSKYHPIVAFQPVYSLTTRLSTQM